MEEGKAVKRIPDMKALAAAASNAWKTEIVSLERLQGHAHSINYRATAENEGGRRATFALKCVPPGGSARLDRLLRHLGSAKCNNIAHLLFGGKTIQINGWTILALEWARGEVVLPDELDTRRRDAFLRAHAQFIDGLADDGAILPAFDAAAAKRELACRCAGDAAVMRELALMDDGTLTLPEEKTRIIHGDLHWENFRFAGGGNCVFFDLEELRFGAPAEDIVRYFACRAEHMHWWDARGRARLAARFGEIVAATPYSLREWLFAINGYFLHKLLKKTAGGGRIGAARRMNIAFRGSFYAELRREAARNAKDAPGDGMVMVKAIGGTVKRFMGGATFDWNGKYRFTCDPACDRYDWLCIYDELPASRPEVRGGRMRISCAKGHTILATQEPADIKHYNSAYVRQFGMLLTNRPPDDPPHAGRVAGEGYMVWYTGRSFAEERMRAIPEKTKGVSAVYSAKAMRHTKHAARQRLLAMLSQTVPGFERFGKGVRPLERKCDALDPFAYHIAFENHAAPGHWTEKIADALVCGCLPFYAGDPGLGRILPPDSFIPIPSDAPQAAAETVKAAMENGERGRRLDAIKEARRLLFEKYNFFAQVVKAIETGRPAPPDGPADSICTRRRARLVHPLGALEDFAWAVRKNATTLWRTIWTRK